MVQTLFGQGTKPSDRGLRAFQLKDKKLGEIDFYLTGNGINEKKPLVFLISGGLNQFYSSIINYRTDAAAGRMTHQESEALIDSLFVTYGKIYHDPSSTDKWYYGHPYKRWGSFCTEIPLDHLVKLDIPILWLNGSASRNTPVLEADDIRLEFLRLGKTNLTYKVLPGADHSLYEVVMEDGKEKGISHREEAFKMITSWIETNTD